MNPQVDEIEEGEIVADELSDSSLNVLHSARKKKSLPRRYTLKENKNVPSKHKKTCKHSIRHHAKRLLKFQKTPNKVQAISYTSHVSPKRTVRRINPGEKKPVHFLLSDKNIEDFSKNSLISEMRGALKSLPSSKKSLQKSFLIKNAEDITLDNLDFPTLLADYKKIQEELKKYKANENVKSDCNNLSTNLKENNATNNEALKLCDESIQNIDNTSIQDSKIEHKNGFIPDSTIEQKTDESEDEDELRRLALATFAKKAVETENVDDSLGKESLGTNSVNTFENPSVNSCSSELVTDNYEIVDMELDEENLSSCEILDDDELFIIDTNPAWSANLQESNSSENLEHPVANQFDDEFEEELLRAQLLASMSGQKKESICQSPNAGTLEKTNSQLNVKTPEIPLISAEKIPPIIPANSLKKINVSKPTIDNITSLNPQKRMIITLTNDSSTEESDTDEESVDEPKETSSTVVNLEALISDARQKSDQSKSSETMDVSCLSKAQQEEYNSYIKILKNTTSQAGANKKQKFPIEDEELKLKERKLLIAEQNCKKEQKLISNILKETFTQRRVYVRSKLKCQLLKEQLLAAERVKKLNLQAYQKSLIQVRTLKKSISKREDLIKSLKDECTKLQTFVTGQNFDLPTMLSNNYSNIDKPNL